MNGANFKLNFYCLLIVGIFFLVSWKLVNGEECTCTNLDDSIQINEFCPSLSPSKNYTSYKRYPWCTPCDYTRYPKSLSEVVAIVKEAIRRRVTVKAFGVRHSQTDIICTEGIPVDCQGLQFFRMNPDNITATFGAGVRLRDATEFLRERGRALRNVPGYGNITIGGAIGTGAHGSTIKYNASISAQVVELTIVDGRGDVRVINDVEELKAFRLSLGLLGVIVDVTLYTVPLYKTKAFNYATSDKILTDGTAIKYAQSTDQIALYWFPALREVVVSNWTIVDVKTPGNAYTNDHTPSTYSITNFITAIARELAYILTDSECALVNTIGYTVLHVIEYYLRLALLVQTPLYVPIYTEDGYFVKNPAVGYYDKMFAPICYDDPRGILGLACSWSHGANSVLALDNEFGLDLADLPAFITDVKDIISKTPTAFPLQGILMRFSNASDIYMSTAYGRQTVHFEFYVWKRNDFYNKPSASLGGYQTILQLLTRKYKARSHWGKSGLVYHNSESLALKLDPSVRQKFIDVMNEFDPNGVFMNSFGRRLKGTGTKVDVDPLTTRCALLDNCICTKDSDCGDSQTCTTLPGYTYRVCKTRNEVPDYDKRIDFHLGLIGYLLTDVPVLVKAALSKCALGAVVDTVGDVLVGLG